MLTTIALAVMNLNKYFLDSNEKLSSRNNNFKNCNSKEEKESSLSLRGNWNQFSSVQSLSCVQLSATSCTAAQQIYLSITNSQSLHKLMSIELVMPSNHLILCCPLLLPPSVLPSIRVFSNESVLQIR